MKKHYLITLLGIFFYSDLFSQDCTIEQITSKIIACTCYYKEEHQSFVVLSKNGMVQIDSYYFPWLTSDAKELILKETNRDDFKYFINTHGHACHTGGNYFFKEAQFIAHERTKGKIEWGINDNKSQYNKLMSLDTKDSTQMKRIEETEFQINNTPVPDITFQDRMTLYLDDVTLHLIYFGECGHSDDEILLHIPEEKTLIIGQILHGSKYLPIIKVSCDRHDIQRKIDVITQLLDFDIDHILSNHQGEIDIVDFIFARDYYIDLLKNIEIMKDNLYSLEQIQTEFQFEKRYPEIVGRHEIREDRKNVHIKNVENVWRMLVKEEEENL